ncbi:SIS domain-containing protein [Oscillospiraceae bacterium PP1C4]
MSDFYKELTAQPQALKRLIEEYQKLDYAPIRKAAALITSQPTVIFSGMGTSYFAPMAIRDKLAPYTKMLSIEAGEFYEGSLEMVKPDDVVMLISQSGESVELVKIASALKGKATILCITNDTNSSLAKCSDVIMPLYCEKEKSITNKTYTNTLAILFLLAGFVTKQSLDEIVEEILQASCEMQSMLEHPDTARRFQEISKYFAPAQTIHFIGKGGASLVSSYQASLIFMEGAKCSSHGFSTGAFRHGPVEVCSSSHNAVIFAQDSIYYDKTTALAEKILANDSKVLMVTNGSYQNDYMQLVHIQCDNEVGFALVSAMVFELLLVYVAESRNLVAGDFAITTKISKID